MIDSLDSNGATVLTAWHIGRYTHTRTSSEWNSVGSIISAAPLGVLVIRCSLPGRLVDGLTSSE